MRFRILIRWPLTATCIAVLCGTAAARGWQRDDSLGAAVGVGAYSRPASASDLSIWDGRALVQGDRVTPADLAAYAAATDARLRAVFDGGGWSVPFTTTSPLRIALVASTGAALSKAFIGNSGSVVALNLADHPPAEAAAETVRDAALFVLHSAAPQSNGIALHAAARALALSDTLLDSDREELREAGAGVDHDLTAAGGEIFSAAWIREMARTAGPDFVRTVWTERVARGDSGLDAFASAFQDLGGSSADAMFGALARLYSADEVIGESARLSESDLVAGALNAASPGPYAWRFFAAPAGNAAGWNVSWPADGARGFAVVHYDEALPSDVVPFSPGERKVLPTAGVSRVDWVVLGRDAAAPLAVPVEVALESEFPVSGLTAAARTESGEGVVLSWTTASHRDLAGWAILRTEVTETGRVIRSAPESLPAQQEDPVGGGWDFVDTSAAPGHFYRYDVFAVTQDGVLAKAFRTTLRAK